MIVTIGRREAGFAMTQSRVLRDGRRELAALARRGDELERTRTPAPTDDTADMRYVVDAPVAEEWAADVVECLRTVLGETDPDFLDVAAAAANPSDYNCMTLMLAYVARAR